MFGLLRLILAAIVAAYHSGFLPGGWNVGVCAVVGFYVVSGFVMSALIDRYYAHPGAATLRFYVDRAMRIWPQFLLFLLLALLVLFVLRPENPYLFDRHGFGAPQLAMNLAIVPLDFSTYISSLDDHVVLPPTWSLGAELQFYLVAPLLLPFRRVRTVVAGASFLVFVAACSGRLESTEWGYRLLPGILFAFLAGAILRDALRGDRWARRTLAVLYALVVLLAMGVWARNGWDVRFRREVLVGFLVVVPLIGLLGRLRPRPLDTSLGNLSYGTFLSHFVLVYSLPLVGLRAGDRGYTTAVVIGAIALGAAGYHLVERPVVGLRRRLRRPMVAPDAPPAALTTGAPADATSLAGARAGTPVG